VFNSLPHLKDICESGGVFPNIRKISIK